jgi:hypothetical protein
LNLLNLFRPRKDLSFLDVSYLRHDPTTQTLILYNNATRSIKNIRLVVKNTDKTSFTKDFEKLASRTGEAVPLSKPTDSAGKPFTGELHNIVIQLNKLKSTFEPQKNKFKKST